MIWKVATRQLSDQELGFFTCPISFNQFCIFIHLSLEYTLWMDSLKTEGPIDIVLRHLEYKRKSKKVTRYVPLMERYICINSLGKRKHGNGALSPAERRQDWNHQKYSPCRHRSVCSQFYGGRCVYILHLNIISGPLHLFNSPLYFHYTTYNYLLFSLRTVLILSSKRRVGLKNESRFCTIHV